MLNRRLSHGLDCLAPCERCAFLKAIDHVKLIDRYRGERSGMHSAEVMATCHKVPSLLNSLAMRTRTTFSNDQLHFLPTSRFDQSAPSSVKRASLAKTQAC